ncbi:MAG: hypothetical protein CVU05_12395 [Bacteroidetes bacterium HGW-Bacteroidetes-21]|jgi:hypothetical protein|nr:MAG: hypothetical protein CVU05_12395 [Bacteroidetes bacterium HGW-Bacteroidetes-21]
MKKVLFSIVLIFSATFVFGQNLAIHMIDGPRGNFHTLPNDSAYRIVFNISGLTTDEMIQDFITKSKAYAGVVNISVKGLNSQGQRNALLIIDGKKDDVYFKGFLDHVGVTKIYYKEKEYTTATLKQLQEDRQKSKMNVETKKANK